MASYASASNPTIITATDIASWEGYLEPEALHAIARRVWRDVYLEKTSGKKSVLHPRESDFWSKQEYAPLRDVLGDERLGWKLSALSAVGPNLAGVKIVGANALNRHFGLDRSSSTFVLLDKDSMRPLSILDGTQISAARTGTYASLAAEIFFGPKERIKVFIFGGGPIARWVCLLLAATQGQNIDGLWVRTRSERSAQAFVTSLAGAPFAIMPVDNNEALAEADLVITASNSKSPVFARQELKPNAVVVHLGGDETPADYLTAMFGSTRLACDDISMVSARGSSSLALYFSNHNTSLKVHAQFLGIKSLSELIYGTQAPLRPAHITCVGIPSLDLYVAEHVYRAHIARSTPLPSRAEPG